MIRAARREAAVGRTCLWALLLLVLAVAALLWQAASPPSPAAAADVGHVAGPADAPITYEPLPDFVPAFDEDSLTLGGNDSRGSMLRSHTIVASTGPEHRTNWELLIPAAQVKADVARTGLTDVGALGAPDNPDVIGWWGEGPAFYQRGNVLLSGHRDYTDTSGDTGVGVNWKLDNTRPGDFIIVRDKSSGDVYVYEITESVSIPWDAPEGLDYLQPSPEPILTLITCEGSFDRNAHNYSQRRIVVATLVHPLPTVPVPVQPALRHLSLEPGWNLIGWTQAAVAPSALPVAGSFLSLFLWDAVGEAFRSYRPGVPSSLNTAKEVRLGDGVWLYVAGPQGAVLELSEHLGGRWVPLQRPSDGHSGFNLVTWTGPDGTPIPVAVSSLGGAFADLYIWDAGAQHFFSYHAGRPALLNTATVLNHGDALWLQVSQPAFWWQPPP